MCTTRTRRIRNNCKTSLTTTWASEKRILRLISSRPSSFREWVVLASSTTTTLHSKRPCHPCAPWWSTCLRRMRNQSGRAMRTRLEPSWLSCTSRSTALSTRLFPGARVTTNSSSSPCSTSSSSTQSWPRCCSGSSAPALLVTWPTTWRDWLQSSQRWSATLIPLTNTTLMTCSTKRSTIEKTFPSDFEKCCNNMAFSSQLRSWFKYVKGDVSERLPRPHVALFLLKNLSKHSFYSAFFNFSDKSRFFNLN